MLKTLQLCLFKLQTQMLQLIFYWFITLLNKEWRTKHDIPIGHPWGHNNALMGGVNNYTEKGTGCCSPLYKISYESRRLAGVEEQLWWLYLLDISSWTSISSWFIPPFSTRSLPFFPRPVSCWERFTSMVCKSLATWSWAGCSRSTTAPSFLSRPSPQRHIRPAARGEYPDNTHTLLQYQFWWQASSYSFSFFLGLKL